MKVFCYYNLHSGQWSVKALQAPYKGLVVAHAKGVHLANVVPRVSEAGRQRVLREQRKNVHAGLVGDLVAMKYATHIKGRIVPYQDIDVLPEGVCHITYNPYKHGSFYFKDSHAYWPYTGSDHAMLGDRQVTVA